MEPRQRIGNRILNNSFVRLCDFVTLCQILYESFTTVHGVLRLMRLSSPVRTFPGPIS